VIGRLAHRRNIEVTLEASGSRGLTATVMLPTDLVTEAPTDEDTDAANPDWEHRANVAVASPRVHAAVPGAPPLIEIAEAPAPITTPDAAPAPAPTQAPAVAEPVGAAAADAPEGVVRRVRGAQLPDLGPAASGGPELASTDAGAVRGRLSSLQAGVRAGREVEVTEAAADLGKPADDSVEEAAPAQDDAVPVRVRGAALPSLGLMDDHPDSHLSPPEANRWKLRSLQLDVDAARRSEQGREAPAREMATSGEAPSSTSGTAPSNRTTPSTGTAPSNGTPTTGSIAEES